VKMQYPLFSQVALTEDLEEYNLKRGAIATIVEHYPMPEGEDDGYSLEGFNVTGVTAELAASQMKTLSQPCPRPEMEFYLRENSISGPLVL
jgi:hypothetical protein